MAHLVPRAGPAADSRRRAVALAALALGVACLFWPLFERMVAGPSDFGGHLRFAREMEGARAPQSERFGFELLVLALSRLWAPPRDLASAAILLATAATAAKAVLSARWLGREMAPARAAAVAAALLFLAPITFAARHPLRSAHSAVHLGQMSGLIFHNPTTVVVFPLVLALFVASWRGRAVSTSLLAALQCFVKPSYVAAWLPVLPALEVWRGRRGGLRLGRIALRTAAIAAAPAAVLAWQFLTSDSLGTIVVGPWRAWRVYSADIPLSIARSLAFPALLAAVHWREVRRRPEHFYAWAVFAVAFAQYALLYLRGEGYAGNWSWGRYLAIYVVFLLSVELFVHVAARRESWRGWRAAANGGLAALLALHLGSGLFYYWQGVRNGLW